MEKQRDIYRQLILTLFKQNFDSALFQEKRDDLMKESDFETIRDEIEEEYFIKNRGISPYIKAIKYLRAKIEACTAAKELFVAVEDYISAKGNIVITKIAKVATIEPTKKVKRTMAQSKEKPIETVQAHAECMSPHPCKKCRIMQRSEGVELKLRKPRMPRKPRKQNPKKVNRAAKKSDIKTEPCKPQYSDISDSETTTTESSFNSTESMPAVAVVKNEERPVSYQLPYHDHQYSRISFYGSGMVEDSAKVDETKPVKSEETVSTNTQTMPKANKHTIKSLLKKTMPVPNLLPTIPHRFKQNNGLRQPSPVCFMQHTISSTSTITTVQAPTVIRPIPRPIPPRPSPSVFVSAPMPISFNAPVAMLHHHHQGPVIRHPVYFIRFCEPPTHQFYPNNLL
ncbi:uncharacterized protein LOC129566354 [Sitodiplosis mosellana]|uniref:uncharacterized protein LOC129566354 n=1 Tax=Sitodiplosis mosellana TaxID=263140 RepID=UPI0024439F4B|nr:uncharacterized protein LOC129566354 [Sitodiplosis mosellana]